MKEAKGLAHSETSNKSRNLRYQPLTQRFMRQLCLRFLRLGEREERYLQQVEDERAYRKFLHLSVC